MSKINIETINEELTQYGWKCLSKTYRNLESELEFECDEGHNVYSTWKKIRNRRDCPRCKDKKLKEQVFKIEPKQKGVKRVLALDQATHTTGWSIFDGNKLIRYGTFTASPNDEIERDSAIKNWMLSMIHNWKPDCVAIEGIQFQDESLGQKLSVTVFQALARLQGILMEACYAEKVDYVICPTNTWRNYCGVKGRYRTDKKRSMQLLAKKEYEITVSDDEADAIGIGKYAAELNKIEITNWE